MGYKTDTNQLADSMAHFVSSQWSIIGHVLFSTRNRNIRISCPFSCYFLMWQHRILIHSQSGLIIGGYWGFMALGHMKPNQNPVVWKLKATCSQSSGQCDNVTMWQNHFVAQKNATSSYISTYLHVSPRISTYLHMFILHFGESWSSRQLPFQHFPSQKLPSAIAESFISILNTVAYYSYLCRKFIYIYIYICPR